MDRARHHLVDARVGGRGVDAERSVGQALRILGVGLARRVHRGKARQRRAVVVHLRHLPGGRVGHAVGAREKPVEIVEAVVLGIDHHDGVDAIERRFAHGNSAAAGEEEYGERKGDGSLHAHHPSKSA